jgi:hypothetical protein
MRAFGVAVIMGSAAAFAVAMPYRAEAAEGDDTLSAGLSKFDEGRKAFEAGQFEEALNAFNASLKLLPSPNTRLYIGRCYRALGKTASAYTELKLAAHEAQDRLTASGEKRYGVTRDTANDEAAELETKVPRLVVAVPSNPPSGLALTINGKKLPEAAWGVAAETDPGTVVVEASGPRLVPFKKTVTLAEGAQERVDVTLTRVPTAIMAVKLKAMPAGLTLTLDGQPLDLASAAQPRELDVGSHALVATAPGFVTFRWGKALADEEKASVDVVLKPDPLARGGGSAGTPKWIFFTLAASSVVALGIASGIAVHANDENNQQLALAQGDRTLEVQNSIKSQATAANFLFVGGGVLGVGALVLAFTTHWKSETSAGIAFAPWIAPEGGGIGARGAF